MDDVGGLRRCHVRLEGVEGQDRGGDTDDLGEEEAWRGRAMAKSLY
jgi:hypothetical protein